MDVTEWRSEAIRDVARKGGIQLDKDDSWNPRTTYPEEMEVLFGDDPDVPIMRIFNMVSRALPSTKDARAIGNALFVPPDNAANLTERRNAFMERYGMVERTLVRQERRGAYMIPNYISWAIDQLRHEPDTDDFRDDKIKMLEIKVDLLTTVLYARADDPSSLEASVFLDWVDEARKTHSARYVDQILDGLLKRPLRTDDSPSHLDPA